ncbi:MAG: cysteine desulfurase family protein [Planctomycetia bacterium]
MSRVYLDHNAATPLRAEVRTHYLEALERFHANPSSVHGSGREARMAIDLARERTAAALGVHEDELLFTSGGTEAANLALLGALRALPGERSLALSTIEHPCVRAPAERLQREGVRIEWLPVDPQGEVDLACGVETLTARPVRLVALMAANNEIGSLLDPEPLFARLPGPRPLLLVDAVQALGRIPLRWRAQGVDLGVLSAHKVGGPKGVGVLYRRKGVALDPLCHGGAQEQGLRPGTENAPAISAAALAIELAVREQPQVAEQMRNNLHLLFNLISSAIPNARFFGPDPRVERRLPNTLNLELPGWDGRLLVARLDLEGLETGSGSACASGSLEASPVLMALGVGPERARAGLRLSLGRLTSPQDIHTAVDILRRAAFSRT